MATTSAPPTRGTSLDPSARAARRARYFLYALGGVFVALGFALDMVPTLASAAPPIAARACALIGAVILAIGRFGSDRLVSRVQQLMTGWL